MTTTTLPALATPKQLAFLARLGGTVTPGLTRLGASKLIDALLKAQPSGTPWWDTPSAERVTDPGMYRGADGSIYKVQRSKQDQTRLYAKRLVPINGNRMVDATEEIVRFEFQYDAGAIRSLTPAQRMSLDEAKAFGLRYGVCCVCGITLKDATSVANGIGPVCARRV